jgi:uracil-DNA glycosylase family 4
MEGVDEMKQLSMEKNNSINKLNQLHKHILSCQLCEDSFGYKPNPVIQGTYAAKIMQISQAPSKKVHETGKPLNDASGKKLRGEWYQIADEDFYNPNFFYIASMAHCYPGKAPGGGDRHPPKICATQWLLREMELVNNEIYIIIGDIAAQHFFPGEKITDLAFQDRELNGKPAYILPHPSPLNMKWFKDYPEFTQERIIKIREEVHKILGLVKIKKRWFQ